MAQYSPATHIPDQARKLLPCLWRLQSYLVMATMTHIIIYYVNRTVKVLKEFSCKQM